MTTSFRDMKKNAASSFDKLNKELEKMNSNSFSKDADEFWQCQTDKAGNGYAVIRFLPAPEGEDMPFVRLWNHGFKGPTGKWYIENCLTTIKETDPVVEHTSILYNSGRESDKKLGAERKRKLSFYSNVYIVKDPANPENEGKVFKFRYGKKIFDKINDMLNPQFEDDEAVDVFNFWTGANFKLKIRKVEGYSNYDKSEFEKPAALLDDDDALEDIWKKQYSLAKIVAPDQFKTYAELKKKLNEVLGTTEVEKKQTRYVEEDEAEDIPFEAEPKRKEVERKPAPAIDDGDDDDDLAFFRGLADDD